MLVQFFFFFIYINDFSNASSYFSTRLFADDTSLTVCGKDLDTLIHHINIELPKIYDWPCANKLTLSSSRGRNLQLSIVLAGQPLDHSSIVKYLGLIIDCHLYWHDHIENICSKISKNINIMTKVTIINMFYSFTYIFIEHMALYCEVTIITILFMM